MNNETIEKAKEQLELQAERTSLKTMADFVKEYLIAYCEKDPDFVERVSSTEKSFMDCIGYIKKKALEWLKEQQNLELTNYAQGIGGDVPNDTCYDWAVEYYYSKPEPKTAPKKVETVSKNKAGKKGTSAIDAAKNTREQQLSLMDGAKPSGEDDAEPITLFDDTAKKGAISEEETYLHHEEEEPEETCAEPDDDIEFENDGAEEINGFSIKDIGFEGLIEEPVEDDELPFDKEAA